MSEIKHVKKPYGKAFARIMDILDILEEIKGPFTTNSIVKEMRKIHKKIRHETIKKYLELIHEISNRGILERSLERSKDSSNLILWNYKSDKKEDSKKLYNYISRFNSINGVNVEKIRKDLNWSPKRMKNTLKVLIKERMIQFKENKIFLTKSWLELREWVNRNSIDLKENKKHLSPNKENLIKKELDSLKIRKTRA